MTIRNLDSAFRPQSIVLVGASERPNSVGHTLMRNLLEGGFTGPIYFINPRHKTLGGKQCYASPKDLPEAPDLAVIATPAETVPGVIAELGEHGTRAAVVLTAGISRDNGLRQAMLDAAKPYLLRIIGPNCLGSFVPHIGLNASFAHIAPAKGNLALLSQSGAVASAILDWAAAREVGFSHVVSMGDMADVDVGDMLDYLASEMTTTAILMYLETITNPRKFLTAARSAARVKPVLVIKAGRGEAAAKAAATHTGALAGNDRVIDAALRRSGVLRVDDLHELFDAAEMLTRITQMHGDRLTILTNGGGAGVLAVESLIELGGRLSELSPETMAKLNDVLPATWSHANPVDIIGDAGPERYEAALNYILDDPATDAVLVMNCPTALASSAGAAQAIIDTVAKRKAEKKPVRPILTNWLGESTARDARNLFTGAKIPSYPFPAAAVQSFSYLTSHAKLQEALMRTPPDMPEGFEVDTAAARRIMADAEHSKRSLLTEPEAKQVLAAYGIETSKTEIARDADEAGQIAERLLKNTNSVVVKILSEDISHKSDVGGVVLNLNTPQAVVKAANDIIARVKEHKPEAFIQGFTVQEMVRRNRAHELIIGVSDDQVFGPTILFGAGGTAVEVIKDTAIALPPLDLKLAYNLVEETRVASLLRGYRDRPAANIDAIAMALVRVSQLITDFPFITGLDINPMLADEKGIVALDARVEIDWSLAKLAAPNPRLAIRPYPKNWEKVVELRSERNIIIRPIQPTDEEDYREFLQAVDPADLRLRFFVPTKDFSHNFVARITQIDYSRAMAFVACDPDTGAILGGSRLMADPDYTKAEYAILVRSALKGQGIGYALMQQLIAYAKAEGLQEMRGDVLQENSAMLNMCRDLGFKIRNDPEAATLCRVILPLGGSGR
jgi:acetyltransferase